MIINICVASNAKYIKYLQIMLLSLFSTNRDDAIIVYVLQQDFSDKDREQIESFAAEQAKKIVLVDIDKSYFKNKLPTTMEYSMEAYFRLLMTEVLPKEVDRVLYLDIDTIIKKPLSKLYSIDLKEKMFAVCQDMGRPKIDSSRAAQYRRSDNDNRYFNSGVMLWNMKEIRKKYSFEEFMRGAAELNYRLPCVDQDILNYMVYKDVLYLDPYKYNFMLKEHPVNVNTDEATIVHFCGRSPWTYPSMQKDYRLWWSYAKQFSFYQELLEGQNQRIFDRFFAVDFPQQKEMRAVLDLALRLKGTRKIEGYLKSKKSCNIIYGCGYMADVFLESVDEEETQSLFSFVIDRIKTGYFHGIPVRNDISVIDKTAKNLIIVTPTRNTNEIKESIQRDFSVSQILTLREFLLMVYNNTEESF